MIITYDENKRRINLTKHGMDFADLDVEFFQTGAIFPAKFGRFIAINILVDGIVTAVFARLGTEGISIISMRPANRKERKLL